MKVSLSADVMKMKLDDLKNHFKTASTSELEHDLEPLTEEQRRKVVRRVLGEWDEDDGVGKLRKQAAKLIPLTVTNKCLSFLHPGAGTAHRGGKQFKTGIVSSWSFSKRVAASYGEVTSKKITKDTPALSLDILFQNNDMQEILIDTKS